MKKQYILITVGLVLTIVLFLFGKTISPKKDNSAVNTLTEHKKTFSINNFIIEQKAKLTPSQSLYLSKLENNISRGDVAKQQVDANVAVANFWRDSAKIFEPYAFFTSLASKLENSEKNLTFAARLFLGNLRGENDEAKLAWETNEAIALFEKAILINPNNDDLKVDLGSCYIYGRGKSGDPKETMQGIQTLLEVARRDSSNLKAQLMLGVGGLVSGQFEKAIPRLLKVVNVQPKNVEAIAYLADAYAGVGNKTEAIKWYNISKSLINDEHYTQEVDARIKTLQ